MVGKPQLEKVILAMIRGVVYSNSIHHIKNYRGPISQLATLCIAATAGNKLADKLLLETSAS